MVSKPKIFINFYTRYYELQNPSLKSFSAYKFHRAFQLQSLHLSFKCISKTDDALAN